MTIDTVNNDQADDYKALLGQISTTYTQGRLRATQAVNQELIQTYWEIGRYIVEYEQKGRKNSIYGQKLLASLSQDLKSRLGKGFSRTNLVYMRLFYQRYPIGQKASDRLSWSHYVELLKIDHELERNFYQNSPENPDALARGCRGA